MARLARGVAPSRSVTCRQNPFTPPTKPSFFPTLLKTLRKAKVGFRPGRQHSVGASKEAEVDPQMSPGGEDAIVPRLCLCHLVVTIILSGHLTWT
jgi:hypothetical protein